MKTRKETFIENFTAAFIACGLSMVQGDLSVFTFGHLGVATEVGIVTGLAMVIAMTFDWAEIVGVWLTGLFTAGVDFITHPAHYPYEAIATGFGAMVIALIIKKVNYGR